MVDAPSENKDTYKVLLIEDDNEDVLLINELLHSEKNTSFDITSAENISKGLLLLGEKAFDIVLLDLGLPDCIGINTFRKVREQNPMMPIIVLTGSTLKRNEIRNCLENADSYLIKGFVDSQSLIESILSATKNHAIRKLIDKHLQKEEVNNKHI